MTLNGVMAVISCYFSEFGSFRGALRKSSRSLSHLLMSSCIISKAIVLQLDYRFRLQNKQTTKYNKHGENSNKSNNSKGQIETNHHYYWKFKRA